MRATARGNFQLQNTPASTGSTTTCSVVRLSAQPSTGTNWPASVWHQRGVITKASSVEVSVTMTARATLARARNAMTFDAVPEGQLATRMSPRAKPRSRLSRCAMPQPVSGMIV